METTLKAATVFVFFGFTLVFAVSRAEMQTQKASDKFKNVTVLGDMPADQMGKVMNLMSAALSVDCNFCHAENNFASDDKEEKRTAREMLKMTFELNKQHFRGRPEVTCNTCHNGREHPQGAPNLMAKPAEERPKQSENKPTIDQIVAKHKASLGEPEKIAKITSRYIKAQRVEPNGKTESEEIWQKNGKFAVTTAYGGFVVTDCFDGAKAWKKSTDGDIELKPDEADQIRREAELFANADITKVYPKMEFRFLDKIDGREVYMVTATSNTNTRERLFFDVATGALVRRSAVTPTILGGFVYQVDYSDIKDFGGVKLPASIRVAFPGVSYTHKLVNVKNNAAIDDVKFMK